MCLGINIFLLNDFIQCLVQTSAYCGFQLKDLKSQKCEEKDQVIKTSAGQSPVCQAEKSGINIFATVHELKMTLRDNKGRQKEGEFDSVRAVDVGLNACQAGTKTELCLFSVSKQK
jgi:hypothetical protein